MNQKAPYSLWQLFKYNNLALHQQFRKGSGKKIVLLHGLGGSGRYWLVPSKYLASNFEVLGYDLLGFGESPKPKPFSYNTWQQADALRKAMWNDHVWGKLNIVGHSLGALVALEFAKRYPQKVRSLTLCNVPILFNSSQIRAINSHYGEIIKNELQRKGIKKIRESEFVHKRIMPRYAKRQMQEHAFSEYDLANVSKYAYAQSLEHSIENQNSLENIEKLTMPVYIIRADKDRLVINSNIDKLATMIPNCRIIDVKSGHQYPVLLPKNFSNIISDLTQNN